MTGPSYACLRRSGFAQAGQGATEGKRRMPEYEANVECPTSNAERRMEEQMTDIRRRPAHRSFSEGGMTEIENRKLEIENSITGALEHCELCPRRCGVNRAMGAPGLLPSRAHGADFQVWIASRRGAAHFRHARVRRRFFQSVYIALCLLPELSLEPGRVRRDLHGRGTGRNPWRSLRGRLS